MTLPPPDAPTPAAPKWKPLTALQRRVLGVLIEKAKTTPAGYPMTVNAVTIGCNQKNNREPLMTLEADDVEQVLNELCELGAASEVYGSGRVAKFRHHGYEWLGVNKAELAVLTELLLRGEQTLGELRGRVARMEPIADLAALQPVVTGLIERGMMAALTAPGRGQVVSHRLYKEREWVELQARYAGHVAPAAASGGDSEAGSSAAVPAYRAGGAPSSSHDASVAAALAVAADRFAELSAEVAELRSEVARLREQVRLLESRLAPGKD